jgi:hypothetical protein
MRIGPGVEPISVDPMPEIQMRHACRRNPVILHADGHRIEFERHAEAFNHALQPVRFDILQLQMGMAPAPTQFLRLHVFDHRNAPSAHFFRIVMQGGGGRKRHDDVVGLGPLPQDRRHRTAAHLAPGHHQVPRQPGGPLRDRPNRRNHHRLVMVHGLGIEPEHVHGPRADVHA